MSRLALALMSFLLAQATGSAFTRMVTFPDPRRAQTDRVDDNTRWLDDSSFGFTIRIHIETLTCREPYLPPDIYLFIDAKDFTEDKLEKVFKGFSELYSPVRFLSITAINEIGILERVMKDRGAFLGSEPDAFTPGSGHLGAFFFRNWDAEEKFQYTPNADKPEFIQVTLKTRGGEEHKLAPKGELKLAASTADTARLKELFEEGAGVKFKGILRFTPLIYAARESTAETVEKLIAEGAEVNARNRYGRTALLEAALAGTTEVLCVLLRSNADVNARDNHHNSALILAVYGNHLEAVRLLLANGADVRATNDIGSTALVIAKRENRNETIIRVLKETGRRKRDSMVPMKWKKAAGGVTLDIVDISPGRQYVSVITEGRAEGSGLTFLTFGLAPYLNDAAAGKDGNGNKLASRQVSPGAGG